MLVAWGLAGYAGAGAVVAGAFVWRGLGRHPGPVGEVTRGARALLFWGALALWPLVLLRWVRR